MKWHEDVVAIRAPRSATYRRITDVGSWSQHWPALGIKQEGMNGNDLVLRIPAGRLRNINLAATVGDWRHEQGFRMSLRGDINGSSEFWLDEHLDATLLHHVIGYQWSVRHSTVTAYRRSVRIAMLDLKAIVQSAGQRQVDRAA